MKKLLPGLVLTGLISYIAMILHKYLLSSIETLTIAIFLGMVYANSLGLSPKFKAGVSFSVKTILKWGIVLLGVKLNFNLLIDLGPKILFAVVFMVTFALVTASILGKKAKLHPKLSILLGVGSSICGASAIVAMGPVIDAEEEDIAISVAVISLLGALGVIIYSFLSGIIPLSDTGFGLWSGMSLQGVAHALAAAGARGAESISMEIGTIVKMARVALLAPVALVLSRIFATSTSDKKVGFPRYVLYFILTGVFFSLNQALSIIPMDLTLGSRSLNLQDLLKDLSNFFILMAMTAMGLGVNLKNFEKKGTKALIMTSVLFICISLVSITIISIFLL